MKIDVRKIGRTARWLFETQAKRRALRIVAKVKYELFDQPDIKERNRKIILALALVFFIDYLMYCLHTNSPIFGIFPTLPTLDDKKEITVYLPSLDGATILREKRSVPVYENDEKTAKELFNIVVNGSGYENTSLAVPTELFVTKVWIHGRKKGGTDICVFDLEPIELIGNNQVIPNSESLFKQALAKTIKRNIPGVKEIIILEKGAPAEQLWEL